VCAHQWFTTVYQNLVDGHVGSIAETDGQTSGTDIEGVIAESLNDHYAAISTDHSYISLIEFEYSSEWLVFQILDHLNPTATGLDGFPAWFLRLGAPVFFQRVAYLFNLSFATSNIPQQWKQTSIVNIFHPNRMLFP